MDRRRRPLDPRTMESAINKIRGVYAAQVVIGDDNVEEIHVIASPLRKPKQVVRDIESMLLVNFGVRVDYRRISLVQMQEERLFQAEGRPRLVAVRSIDGPTKRAEVEMEKDGHLYIGSAHGGVGSDADTIRLVCTATIEAMQQVLGEHVTYRVDEIEQITVSKMPAIVVAVTLDFGTSQEMLLGICQVRGEPADAAARATLNAVNRRLLILKQDAGPDSN
jgi:hypothetical protein